MSHSRTTEEFFKLGTQYYAIGRFAFFSGSLPVAGNIMHLAVEMFLKGYLSKHHSSNELKKTMSHNLMKLWSLFKSYNPDLMLNKFDKTVASLDRFYKLRYPDNILNDGATITISTGSEKETETQGDPRRVEPSYQAYLTDIDDLTFHIFRVSSLNTEFFFQGLNSTAKEFLKRDNHAYTN